MGKVIYKFFRHDCSSNVSLSIEPGFDMSSDPMGDIATIKNLISRWDSGVVWETIDEKYEGFIHSEDPFSVMQIQMFCGEISGKEDATMVFGFNVLVRCNSFQLGVEKNLCDLAKSNGWSIRKMEWQKLV